MNQLGVLEFPTTHQRVKGQQQFLSLNLRQRQENPTLVISVPQVVPVAVSKLKGQAGWENQKTAE